MLELLSFSKRLSDLDLQHFQTAEPIRRSFFKSQTVYELLRFQNAAPIRRLFGFQKVKLILNLYIFKIRNRFRVLFTSTLKVKPIHKYLIFKPLNCFPHFIFLSQFIKFQPFHNAVFFLFLLPSKIQL